MVPTSELSTVLGSLPLEPGDQNNGSPCSLDVPGDDLALTTNGAGPGTWSLAGGYANRFQLPGTAVEDPWYQGSFELTGSGTYTGGPTSYGLDGSITLDLEIYEVVGPACVPDDLTCVVTGVFALSDSGYVGSLPVTGPGDDADVVAETDGPGIPLSTSSCDLPWSGLDETDATMDLHLTVA